MDAISLTAQESLKIEISNCGSMRRVAKNHDVNPRYLWEFINRDKEPHNVEIRKKLGLSPLRIGQVVFVGAGNIPDGCQVLDKYSVCACGQNYISNHPRRSKCFTCSEKRKRGKNEIPLEKNKVVFRAV